MVLLGMLEQAGVEVRPLAGWHSATRPSDWTRCGWGCEGVMLVKRCQRLCGLSPMTNRTSASRSENVGSKVLGARSSFHQ